MTFLRSTMMAMLAAAAMATAANRPAEAARSCSCTNILSSGYCTEYGNCHELEMIVGTPFRPVRSLRDCRGAQALICDGASCKIVCPATKK